MPFSADVTFASFPFSKDPPIHPHSGLDRNADTDAPQSISMLTAPLSSPSCSLRIFLYPTDAPPIDFCSTNDGTKPHLLLAVSEWLSELESSKLLTYSMLLFRDFRICRRRRRRRNNLYVTPLLFPTHLLLIHLNRWPLSFSLSFTRSYLLLVRLQFFICPSLVLTSCENIMLYTVS